MADDYDYYEPDDESFYREKIYKKYLTGKLYWITKNKDKILVGNMTDDHIANCLKIPKYHNKEKWDVVFNFELNIRKKC